MKKGVFMLISLIFLSCKGYKEVVIENPCGSKIIELVKERPYNIRSESPFYAVSFLSGFQNDTVKISVNDSVYFEKVLLTNFSTSYADSYVFKEYVEELIKITIGGDSFCFTLDKNYLFYYEIHNSERQYYLNLT